MPARLTIEDVARAYQEANPGTAWEASVAWARAEVAKQSQRQIAAQENGTGQPAPAVAPEPPPPPPWKAPIYEAAEVLLEIDQGKINPVDGLQAAAVLLVAAAAKL